MQRRKDFVFMGLMRVLNITHLRPGKVAIFIRGQSEVRHQTSDFSCQNLKLVRCPRSLAPTLVRFTPAASGSLIPFAPFTQRYGQRLVKIVRLMRSVREVERVTDAFPHEEQPALLIKAAANVSGYSSCIVSGL